MNRMKLNSETITLLAIKDISNELNEKESESWNKLTRVLTHEIMNTIAPIVSLSQTLSLRPGTDEKVIRGLGVIREQSERLMEFTESYRRLSYMPEPKKKRFSLTNSLHNLGLLLQSDFENAHIHFILRSTPLIYILRAMRSNSLKFFKSAEKQYAIIGRKNRRTNRSNTGSNKQTLYKTT